ncbi:hypothetical protein [Streptomyces longisporoflavus]|uniref:hypothetical protein n=1 Tax=Streptomyces longisporoflavus TaxID=28044 RepID=UPI00167C8CBB|nr:hypothetical protein [Streptomyces longisporoflavus]
MSDDPRTMSDEQQATSAADEQYRWLAAISAVHRRLRRRFSLTAPTEPGWPGWW